MAGLADLRIAMGTSIFLVAFIFAAFLGAVLLILDVFFLNLSFIGSILLALAGTGLFILFEYLVGPAIVKSSTHLHYLQTGDNPWLETTVKELADRSNIPTPKLAIVPDNNPNAFTFGRTQNSATLAVHEGLLKNLNENEIKGVIGHELGHIKHKDYIVMTILSAMPLLAYLIARGTWTVASTMRGGKKDSGSVRVGFFAVAAISYLVYFVSLLCVMRLSRLREHYADAYSAYLTNQPRNLESALAKITYGLSLSSKAPSGARAFYIEDPALAKQEVQVIMEKKDEYDLNKDGVLDDRELELAMEKEAKSTWVKLNTLFATHPPTFKRILLLHEIETEMESGRYTTERVYSHI